MHYAHNIHDQNRAAPFSINASIKAPSSGRKSRTKIKHRTTNMESKEDQKKWSGRRNEHLKTNQFLLH